MRSAASDQEVLRVQSTDFFLCLFSQFDEDKTKDIYMNDISVMIGEEHETMVPC